MSSNALGWVFPGAGDDTPPSFSQTDFGPIHWKDSIILQFTPASYTGAINLYCDYDDTQQGNIWNLDNTGSPLTYTFTNQTPNAQDTTDYHACHFFFVANTVSTSSGNTLAFQYLNNATKQANTWSINGVQASGNGGTTTSSSSTSSTSTTSSTSSTSSKTKGTQTTTSAGGAAQTTSSGMTTSTTSSSTSVGVGAATGSNSPDITAQQQSSGLSGGAIAGIVIGIVALIAIIAGLGFFFGRRARRNKNGPTPLPPTSENKATPMYQGQHAPGHQVPYPQGAQPPPAWSEQKGAYAPNQVRMGELQGNQISELHTPVYHELGGGARNELPG